MSRKSGYIKRKGNENNTNYRNVSSLLNQSPQLKSKQNIAQNREEGNEHYKLDQQSE
ncbi:MULTISPECIES: hypothetical protein [Bacillaceae]|uniref:hypothetical protein n=1 Tax=Bacillaceae TaxID=186817 RepID=UPI000A54284A|nr:MULTISPECIES: hypothetical protein [Bacillaceae]MDF2067962.1 hypothetical protein [Bacillus sp. Cr_A10]